MIYAIISDVHANLEALAAVLAAMEGRQVDRVVCLGDIVGYNADPSACLETVLSRADLRVRGNHDKAVASLAGIGYFNEIAAAAVRWSRGTMSPSALEALGKLPEGPCLVDEAFLICHGSPIDEDQYIMTYATADTCFRWMKETHPLAPVCFFGHTHIPLVLPEEEERLLAEGAVELDREKRYLINVGSVGQPRDGDPRAAFGLFDATEWSYEQVRVPYEIALTQSKVLEAGLPAALASRLAVGR